MLAVMKKVENRPKTLYTNNVLSLSDPFPSLNVKTFSTMSEKSVC